jgi:hypothetical protein
MNTQEPSPDCKLKLTAHGTCYCRMGDHEFKFYCPILRKIFENPVKAEDGRTYERQGIEEWFESCRKQGKLITSPWLRDKTMGTTLVADRTAAAGAKKLCQQLAKETVKNLPSIHDLSKVFATLDPLRNILEKSLDGWKPPQLVVIGEENSGKSSVLERLAMMPIFPRNHRLCTRLPIHVRLRNKDKCMPTTIEVFNTKTNKTEEEAYVIPTEYGAVDVRGKMQEIIAKEHACHQQRAHHHPHDQEP